MASATDLNDLEIGTPVQIVSNGLWGEGYRGTIAKSYTIRFGHRMYDIADRSGHLLTYYAPSQLKLL